MDSAVANIKEISIIFENNTITYEQLENRISICMEELEKRKLENGVIGVMMSRTPVYIYWIMAILASGYAFVPINPQDAEEKRNYVITHSNMDYCITDNDCKNIDWDKNVKTKMSLENILDNEDKMAYIMFTSGTTGFPKGVMISRKSLNSFTKFFLNGEIIRGNLILANTTFTFDISLLEIILSLKRGATIFLTSDNEQKNPRSLVNILKKNRFDWAQFTPSYLNMLIGCAHSLEIFKNVKNIIIGGERITNALANLLKEKTQCRLFNAYGPTEATIWTHVGDLRDSFVNVGKPIECVEELILDSDGNNSDKGVLWLGGDTISQGYYNDNVLTAKKFKLRNGRIIYETGDIACKKDGKLIILGRNDYQVKISGKRIELEEIECKIVENLGLSQCVVLYKEGDLVLCVDDKTLKIEELRKQMLNKIEAVFLPRKIFCLGKNPLMSNGKIDRKKVEDIYMKHCNTRTKEKVLELIREFVVVDFDLESNFEDLGISSIEYIGLIVKLEKAFNIEFDDQTLMPNHFIKVEDLANYIQDRLEQ